MTAPNEELAAAYKIRAKPLYIVAPPPAVVQRLRRELKIQYDWPTGADTQEALDLALRAARLRPEVRAHGPKADQVLDRALPSAPSVHADEARVREGKRSYHESLLQSWGIPLPEPHPTNAGISAMRMKNAALHALKKGHKLP